MHTYILDERNLPIPEDTEELIIQCDKHIRQLWTWPNPLRKLPFLQKITIENKQSRYKILQNTIVYNQRTKEIEYIPYNITTLFIPDFVENLPYHLPHDMQLEHFDVDENNPFFSSENGLLLDKEGKNLLLCPPAKKQLVIPDTVTDIQIYALDAVAKSLTDIIIPETAKLTHFRELNNLAALRRLTIDSFGRKQPIIHNIAANSRVLERIDIPDNHPYLITENKLLYNRNMTELYRCLCTKTDNVVIPNTITNIRSYAFAHTHFRRLLLTGYNLSGTKSLYLTDTDLQDIIIDHLSFTKNLDKQILLITKEQDFDYSDKSRIILDTQKLQTITINGHTFGKDDIVSCLTYLPCIVMLLDTSCPVSAWTIIRHIQIHDSQLLPLVLQRCLQMQPDILMQRISPHIKRIAALAVEENQKEILQILMDKTLLKKQHLDALIKLSIDKQRPETTVLLIDYKHRHTRYQNPADKLKL